MKHRTVRRSAFRIVRNKNGFVKAIAHGRQHVLQITEGTVVNEHFADQLLAILKCAERLCDKCEDAINVSKRLWRDS